MTLSRKASWRAWLGNGLALLVLAATAGWLLSLQSGPWPMPTPLSSPRWIAALALLAYVAGSGWIAWQGRARSAIADADHEAASWCVAYASQTGFARELAERTTQALRDAGQPAFLRDIAELGATTLAGRRCLFIASTTGEGDPPDHALAFVRRVMAAPGDLQACAYAVLALGDRGYARFCAFGHQLDGWLRQRGARPLFDLIEVDNADPSALRHWQHHVGVAAGRTDLPDWTRPAYQPWRLVERRLLNPGSVGGPAFHLALQAPAGVALDWQAGDLAEIGPRNAADTVQACLRDGGHQGDAMVPWDGQLVRLAEALSKAHLPATGLEGDPATAVAHLKPLPHREYSIASLPADGQLHLLVRLMQHPGGQPGLGSGWLCRHAPLGAAIDLRLRANPNFHAPDPQRPMILIGNGTGLAGLRAHLKARIAAGASRNWLLFGERQRAHDAFHDDELEAWERAGMLHLDRVYSRDGGPRRYVQDALRAHAIRLRAWLDDDAVVYVCGSMQGMAPGVDAVLVELLGQHGVEALHAAGRYRRDVY